LTITTVTSTTTTKQVMKKTPSSWTARTVFNKARNLKYHSSGCKNDPVDLTFSDGDGIAVKAAFCSSLVVASYHCQNNVPKADCANNDEDAKEPAFEEPAVGLWNHSVPMYYASAVTRKKTQRSFVSGHPGTTVVYTSALKLASN
jgi:hypothetical protein